MENDYILYYRILNCLMALEVGRFRGFVNYCYDGISMMSMALVFFSSLVIYVMNQYYYKFLLKTIVFSCKFPGHKVSFARYMVFYVVSVICILLYICVLELIYLFMVFKGTFNNIAVISWRSVLLVEETGVPGENHRPVASRGQTSSHNVVSSTPHHERGSNSQL